MIHVADTKVERRYGEFFVRQVHKLEEVSYSSYYGTILFARFTREESPSIYSENETDKTI